MRSVPDARLLLCLLLVFGLALAGTPFAAAGQNGDQAVTIETFAYAGDGSVRTPQGTPFVWQSASHSFDVVLAAGDGGGDYEVCIQSLPADADAPTGLGCQVGRVEAGGATTVTVGIDGWPANLTGEQEVSAVVRPANDTGGEPVARQSIDLTVIQRDADPDEDGLTNEREAEAGTDFFAADTDGDGLADGLEVDTYETDPNEGDTDGDGLDDGPEVSVHRTDPTAADTDGDRLDDDQELNEYGTNPNKRDTDGDGLTDAEEVNTYGTNPNEADTDGDGLGDAAEVNEYGTNPNETDTDGDGLEDGPEVTVFGTDPNERDTDSDGLNDAVEVNQYQTDPMDSDSDDDGLADGDEVEKHDTDPNKADTDGDGLDDGEEVEGGTDPLTPDAEQAADEFPTGPREAIGVLFVVGALVLLGLFVFFSRSAGDGVTARIRALGASGDDAEAGDGAADETVSTGGPSDVTGSATDGTTPPIPTNQNRVLELLRESGGRMLQSDIVDATDWSKSKVSRVLSDMDEEGEITKIDVGKGNLIALPEVAPPNTRSPLDADEE